MKINLKKLTFQLKFIKKYFDKRDISKIYLKKQMNLNIKFTAIVNQKKM